MGAALHICVAHFVSNKVLTEQLSNWTISRKQALANDLPAPQIPDAVAESILLMARKYACKPNFAGYVFVEDMIADSVLCCCRYLHNFNPAKSSNGFAYITQIIHNAFIRHIQKEKEVMYRHMLYCESTEHAERQWCVDSNLDNPGFQSWKSEVQQRKNKGPVPKPKVAKIKKEPKMKGRPKKALAQAA